MRLNELGIQRPVSDAYNAIVDEKFGRLREDPEYKDLSDEQLEENVMAQLAAAFRIAQCERRGRRNKRPTRTVSVATGFDSISPASA